MSAVLVHNTASLRVCILKYSFAALWVAYALLQRYCHSNKCGLGAIPYTHVSKLMLYRIAGKFGEGFNFVVWRIDRPTAKLILNHMTLHAIYQLHSPPNLITAKFSCCTIAKSCGSRQFHEQKYPICDNYIVV